MNSKIKELAEQAKQYARTQMNHSMNSNFFSAPVFEQKFAELIIEECKVALRPALRDMISRGHACDRINNHFAIKE